MSNTKASKESSTKIVIVQQFVQPQIAYLTFLNLTHKTEPNFVCEVIINKNNKTWTQVRSTAGETIESM